MKGKIYVVTDPREKRGIYEGWTECERVVKGVSGARFQAVRSREAAEAILSGAGLGLEPGLWVFTDGNAEGGVGLVGVQADANGGERVVFERSLDAAEALSGINGLDAASELKRIRNVLAELAGLYIALRSVEEGSSFTIVHDYEGVGAWMEGRWRMKDPAVRRIVTASKELAERKRLGLRFRRQDGHGSEYLGNNSFVRYNARADELATKAIGKRSGR